MRAAAAASGPAQAGPAEAALTQATRGLFALMENYPQLKANDNVKQLQQKLAGLGIKSNTEKLDTINIPKSAELINNNGCTATK